MRFNKLLAEIADRFADDIDSPVGSILEHLVFFELFDVQVVDVGSHLFAGMCNMPEIHEI